MGGKGGELYLNNNKIREKGKERKVVIVNKEELGMPKRAEL